MLNLTKEIEMPKNNKTVKHDGIVHKQKVSATLRIGNRKTGTSAHAMTNNALLAVLTNKSQSKFYKDAATVLTQRGIEFEWPSKLTA